MGFGFQYGGIMENSSRFFRNDGCEFFPCHKVGEESDFNCLFCYCPLYRLADCGGSFTLLENGVKDCSGCILPHSPDAYDYIIKRLSER